MNGHVAVVAATGAVGQEFIRVLEQRRFPCETMTFLASARSAGKPISFNGKTYTIQELTGQSFEGVDLALFSAGGSISKQYGPIAARAGAVVVDNSSAFRMDPEVPLVVPEVNPRGRAAAQGHHRQPELLDHHHERAGVAAAQAAADRAHRGEHVPGGAAARVTRAMLELEEQTRQRARAGRSVTPQVLAAPDRLQSLLPQLEGFGDNGYNEEEMKMVKETRKIFHAPSDPRSAPPACACPCCGPTPSRSTSTFARPVSDAAGARGAVAAAPGVQRRGRPRKNHFPMPLEASRRRTTCWSGRIRQDISQPDGRGIELFVAATSSARAPPSTPSRSPSCCSCASRLHNDIPRSHTRYWLIVLSKPPPAHRGSTTCASGSAKILV